MQTKIALGEMFSTERATLDPTRFPSEDFALFSIPAYDTRAPELVSGNAIGSAKQIVRAGDVLLSRIVPHIRRAWVVESQGSRRLLASSEWIVFSSDRVEPEYLRFALLSDQFHRQFMTTVGGVGGSLLRAQRDQVAQLEIPHLALDEQRAIAAALRVVSLGISLELAVAAQVGDLKLSLMRHIFTRGLRGEAQKESEIGPIPESWNLISLGDLGRVGNGSTPKRSVPGFWNGGNYPWLTSAKVYERDIVTADQFVTAKALDECHLPRVKPGAILIAITGQGKTLGNCAVLRMEATISQHLAYLQVNASMANPSFLRYYIETKYSELRQVASGGGSTKGALTCAYLRSMCLPLPSLEEQREIADTLDALDANAQLHVQKRKLIEELFKSLLNGLMSGEIDVNDLDLSALETPS